MASILKVDTLKDTSDNTLLSSSSGNVSISNNLIVDTNTLYVDSTNNRVGIGTSSPSANLHISDTSSVIRFTDEANSQSYQWQSANGRFEIRDVTNSVERFTVLSTGEIGIGTTGPVSGCELTIQTSGNFNSQTSMIIKNTDASPFGGEYLVFQDGNGTAGSISSGGSGSVAYNTSSDYRLKENVVEMTGATERLKQLSPKRFNFIADADKTIDGFLAHEVQSVVPEAITGTYNGVKVWTEDEELPEGVSVGDNKLDDEGNPIPVYQGIDQSKLVPLLTASLKEALTEIDNLKARIEALENV